MPASQQLAYNSMQHRYSVGRLVLPSVTQVLPDDHLAGLSESLLEAKRLIGIEVHEVTAKIDLGLSRIGRISAKATPYVEAHRAFLKEHRPKVLAVEHRGWNKRWLYAGTLDNVYGLSEVSLVDKKCTASIEPEAALQTAAYLELVPQFKCKKRFTLQLKPDGTYKLHEWKEKGDFANFIHCLEYYRWCQAHRPSKPLSIKEIVYV